MDGHPLGIVIGDILKRYAYIHATADAAAAETVPDVLHELFPSGTVPLKLPPQEIPRLAAALIKRGVVQTRTTAGGILTREDRIAALTQILSVQPEIVDPLFGVDPNILDGTVAFEPPERLIVVEMLYRAVEWNVWDRQLADLARERRQLDEGLYRRLEENFRAERDLLIRHALALLVKFQEARRYVRKLTALLARFSGAEELSALILTLAELSRELPGSFRQEVSVEIKKKIGVTDYNPHGLHYQNRYFGMEVHNAAKTALQLLGAAPETGGLAERTVITGDRAHPNLSRWIQQSLKRYFPQTALTILFPAKNRRANARSMIHITGLAFEIGEELILQGEGEDAEAAVHWLFTALSATRDKTQPLWDSV